MHVGKRIRALVETEGLSVTEVAQTIDKTRQTVYDLYNKEHVSTEILEKLSLKYAVPLAYFFDDYFPPPQNLTAAPPAQPRQAEVRSAPNQPEEESRAYSPERIADLNKIIYLQERMLTYEQARQSFLVFLDRLQQSIINQRGYHKRLPPEEEKERLKGTSFSEAYETSAEDNQRAYEEVFRLYDDFEVFFTTGFITDVYWKRAWQKYQQAKGRSNPK